MIEKAAIPFIKTLPEAVYSLIHTLMTLRTAVVCTINKILCSDSKDEHNLIIIKRVKRFDIFIILTSILYITDYIQISKLI
jgi:hypothetical protein